MKIPSVKKMDDLYDLGKEVVKKGYSALKTNIMFTGEPSEAALRDKH